MSLTLLRGKGGHVPRFLRHDEPKSLALECVLQVLVFLYIQSEMAENAPIIVMSFVGWWPTLEGSQSFRLKLWRSFLMW